MNYQIIYQNRDYQTNHIGLVVVAGTAEMSDYASVGCDPRSIRATDPNCPPFTLLGLQDGHSRPHSCAFPG